MLAAAILAAAVSLFVFFASDRELTRIEKLTAVISDMEQGPTRDALVTVRERLSKEYAKRMDPKSFRGIAKLAALGIATGVVGIVSRYFLVDVLSALLGAHAAGQRGPLYAMASVITLTSMALLLVILVSMFVRIGKRIRSS